MADMKKIALILLTTLLISSCNEPGSSSVIYSEEYTYIHYTVTRDKSFIILIYDNHSYLCVPSGGCIHLESCSCKNINYVKG